MFAVILIGYELRSEKLDQTIRDRFGFMYSPWGRCLFLCLYVQYAIGLSFHVLNRISVFPIGMMGMYGVLVSMLGFANAYFNYFVITKVCSVLIFFIVMNIHEIVASFVYKGCAGLYSSSGGIR